jgi:hypothetical protein
LSEPPSQHCSSSSRSSVPRRWPLQRCRLNEPISSPPSCTRTVLGPDVWSLGKNRCAAGKGCEQRAFVKDCSSGCILGHCGRGETECKALQRRSSQVFAVMGCHSHLSIDASHELAVMAFQALHGRSCKSYRASRASDNWSFCCRFQPRTNTEIRLPSLGRSTRSEGFSHQNLMAVEIRGIPHD